MILQYRLQTNPFFNIAAEEYFVKTAKSDMCMLWINEKSVIVGKHQNAYNEINYPFIKENDIPVIRRISGGGTVFHDLGNLNFSFIHHKKNNIIPDFSSFANVIVDYLKHLGLPAGLGNRNSIFVGEKKVSGHAEHIYKDKILHHGTILFNTDLKMLSESIISAKHYKSKALASVRSQVANISPLVPQFADINAFALDFMHYMKNHFKKAHIRKITKKATEKIQLLADKKYVNWNWNFGYSPSYAFPIMLPCCKKPFEINVRNGIVENIIPEEEINKDCNLILENLIGLPHHEEAFEKFAVEQKDALNHLKIGDKEFIKMFF